jgi:hypothetical protein
MKEPILFFFGLLILMVGIIWGDSIRDFFEDKRRRFKK